MKEFTLFGLPDREPKPWWLRYMSLADRPEDDAQSLLEHRFLILAGTLMSGGGLLWGSISAYSGLWKESMVPYGYVVVTAFNFAALSAWKNFTVARRVQVAASILLPFLFQWVLGGFASSGGMMYWAMVGLIGSLSFDDTRTSLEVLGLFVMFTIVSAVFDAYGVFPVPAELGGPQLSALFIGLNFVVVTSVVFFLTLFFVRERHDAIMTLSARNEELAVSKLQAERALRQADDANAARGRFLAVVSHEMRTPLNGVIGLTNLVMDTDLGSRQRELLGQASVSAETLAAIINDVLDFSKIEAGGVTLEHIPFQLDDVLHRLTSAAHALTLGSQVEFVLDLERVPHVLVGDPTRLGQVMLNLVSNAIKFTERGEVVLRMSAEPTSGDTLMLRTSVEDTGIGIAPEHLDRLFEPFEQADDSTTRRYGGTGLGLPICMHFVELMGGTLEVESAPDEGSTFTFVVPLGYEDDAARAVPDALRGTRALVVDDNASARQVLTGYLHNFGIHADAVEGAQGALEAVDARDYGLVLADLRMPDVDGIELIRRLRAHPRALAARLVLVTAFGSRRDEEAAALAGADGFLSKPLRPSMLLDKLVDLFAGARDVSSNHVPRKTSAAPIRGARVLIVEDNDINREILVSALSREGLEIALAVDGQDALDRVRAPDARFDIVLMDLQMPNMDGITATRLIRQSHPDLPIVGVTANALSDTREECVAAGMNEVVTKPIHMELLFTTMIRTLGEGFVPAAAPSPDVTHAPSPSPTTRVPEIEGIDTAEGLARAGGDATLYADLLRRFSAHHAGAASRMRHDLAAGRGADAARTAHTLKGVSGNIGAREVFAVASALQDELDGPGAEVEPLLGELDALLTALGERVDAALSVSGAPRADAPFGDADLAALAALARDDDAEALERFAGMRAALEARWGERDVAALAEALDGFDFEAAVALLEARGPG